MKKCEKHAGRQESDGTRVGINKELISPAVGGLWSWKGEGKKWKWPQNKQRQGESESQIFITFTSRAIMFTKRGCRRGGGNLSEENSSFRLRIVQFFPQHWVNRREKWWTTWCQTCSKTMKEAQLILWKIWSQVICIILCSDSDLKALMTAVMRFWLRIAAQGVWAGGI